MDDPTDLNPHFNAFAREMGWYETHQIRGTRIPYLLDNTWDEIDQYLQEITGKQIRFGISDALSIARFTQFYYLVIKTKGIV